MRELFLQIPKGAILLVSFFLFVVFQKVGFWMEQKYYPLSWMRRGGWTPKQREKYRKRNRWKIRVFGIPVNGEKPEEPHFFLSPVLLKEKIGVVVFVLWVFFGVFTLFGLLTLAIDGKIFS